MTSPSSSPPSAPKPSPARRFTWLEQLRQDLAYACRQFSKARGFAAVAVLTLALGIGVSTALYSVADGVLLHPFSYRKAGEIWCPGFWDVKGRNENYSIMSDYPEIAALPGVASAMASTWTMARLTGAENPEVIKVVHLSDTAFNFLGLPPLLGRGLGPADIRPGGVPEQVAVLTYKAWRRLYNCDPQVLGRTLKLDDKTYVIVGVAAPRFGWKTDDGLFIPLGLQSPVRWVNVNLRLKPDSSPQAVEQQFAALYQRLAHEQPDRFSKSGIKVKLPNFIDISVANGELSSSLAMLFGAVFFLLLIACTNVANLQLARGAARSREMAVRLALGAGRGRLVRQLLTESVVLSLAGGALGCLLAYGLTKVVVTLIPVRFIPAEATVTMSGAVLLFSLIVSVVTGILFGLVPALQTTRPDLNASLKDGGHGTAGGEGVRQKRLRGGLVIVEVALAVILLVGASLTIRGFVELRDIDPGFHPERTLQMSVPLSPTRYNTPEKCNAFARELLGRIDALPGVRLGAIGGLPYMDEWTAYTIPGQDIAEHRGTAMSVVSAGYRAALGIPLLSGRDLTEQDVQEPAPVALINEAAAGLWSPGENPIGRTIRLATLFPKPWTDRRGPDPNHPPTPDAGIVTIVGVIGNTRNQSLVGEVRPSIFIPYPLASPTQPSLIVRTDIEPTSLLKSIRIALRTIDPELPLFRPMTADEILGRQTEQPRFNMALFTALAALSLALACAGIYSVLSYHVAQRTREFGVRMALGAQPSDVLHLVLREGGSLLGAGLLIGLIGSYVLAKIITSQVFVVPLADPFAIAAAAVLLCGAAFLACWLPARRATKVNPMIALRAD